MTTPVSSTVAHLLRGTLSLLVAFAALASRAQAGERLNFDPDWKFIKSDPSGAASPTFDDHDWTTVSAPHTYNDTDTFDDWSVANHHGEQNQWGGRTWYRKTFFAPPSYTGKKVYIEFEGVRQVAEVYLNGQLLGTSKSGFVPFGFDLTRYLKIGEKNVLAVMCDNRFMKDPLEKGGAADEMKARSGATIVTKDGLKVAKDAGPGQKLADLSAKVNATIPDKLEDLQADQIPWNNPHWHPAHGGIYRNVYLHIVDPLHISLPLYSFLKTTGPYVYATDITPASAQIHVEVPIQNERKSGEDIELHVNVVDADGKSILSLEHVESIAGGSRDQFVVEGAVSNPHLWEPAYPYLYHVVCSLKADGKIVDTQEVPLGIRTVRWDAQTGFFINGHHLKLHGWGQKPTDEWPGLGAALPDWMHFYTLDLMKEAGGNIVRWGHSAAGPGLISAGDHLGIIAEQPGVEGESDTRGAAWLLRAASFRDVVIYYRNNPSILIWEGGNQKVTREHAKELRGYMDKYDPHGGRVYAHRRADEVTAEFMDIGIGTEGGREIARLPVVEGEYDREESPRRVWDNESPPNFGYPEAKGQTYQLTSEQYAVNEVAQYVQKLGAPNHAGGSNWIFSDSTSGGRLATEVARASGEVDGVRLPKEAYDVCKTMFRSDPQVHIIGHWTYPPKTKKTVYVVSNGDDVELFINGKSLAHGKVSDHFLFTFPDVEYQPGEIKAVASKKGQVIATDAHHTVGPPVALRITPITAPGGLRADGSDVALFDVEAIDAKGDRCPTFQQRADFEVSGPGIWRGGYNSGKIKSTNNLFLDLESGINRVAVRSTLTPGKITLRARSGKLKSAKASVEAKVIPIENGATTLMPATYTVQLPKEAPAPVEEESIAPALTAATNGKGGQYITSFSYSGPIATVHVETGARDEKTMYVDRNYKFALLPTALSGADYVQAAESDSIYNAVDLMEVAVKAGTVISVAHDNRLARPAWLTGQFTPTEMTVSVDGRPMTLFQHRADRDESLTLGANTEKTDVKDPHMYIVFVNAARAGK